MTDNRLSSFLCFTLALLLSASMLSGNAGAQVKEPAQSPGAHSGIPYGAVYYRRSNPPERDWERDYGTASEDGMNTFRHWFMWNAIEIAPGQFEWRVYDRQLDLAAKHNMKTIIAEISHAAPEWAFRKYAHARYESATGERVNSQMGVSSATGGFPGLCLDNPDVQEAAGNFITAFATRYRNHPGLGGYDIWNESNNSQICYCAGTQTRFREWLKTKYKDLRMLGETWGRYSFAEWEDVSAPRTLAPYPESLDWLQFRIDNAYRLMRWRAGLIRKIDSQHTLTAHGIAATLTRLAPAVADDWRAAAEVEVYGYTWGSSRHGDEPWKQYHAVDMVRAASRGKPFWHAEAYAGPLWMQSNVLNKPRDEGRIASPEDVRLWDMVSFAAGARGLFYLRFRPLLDGPLFGAFGAYGMDGSRTDRSQMVVQIGKWVQDKKQKEVMQSRPVKGDIAILIAPETQLFTYAQQNSTEYFAHALEGAYQGFFHNNIQADWVRLEHINEYDLIYLPFPVMLEAKTAEPLKRWVEQGGTLISEGCPGYFGDRGHVGETQPNLGLAELFGAKESYVEFTPDLLKDLTLNVNGNLTRGGLFLQAYQPTTGTAIGKYADGKIAAVENRFGRGRTLLIGTFPGYGHGQHKQQDDLKFFAWLMRWAGKTPHLQTSEPRVTARLQDGPGGTYVWLTNPTRTALPVSLELSSAWRSHRRAESLWGASDVQIDGQKIKLSVAARNAAVIKLAP